MIKTKGYNEQLDAMAQALADQASNLFKNVNLNDIGLTHGNKDFIRTKMKDDFLETIGQFFAARKIV